MIFSFFIHFICSFQNILDLTTKKTSEFVKNNELKCFSDILYINTYISESVVCFIRCTFDSINSTTEGGAIFIDLKFYGKKSMIKNCTFTRCYSKSGSAFYFKYKNSINSTIQITDSLFEQNTAYKAAGGSIYIFPDGRKINVEIENCIFKSNSAVNLGGSIYLNNVFYSINKSKFISNNVVYNKYATMGSAIYIERSSLYNEITDCFFANNSKSSSISFMNEFVISYIFYNCEFTNNSGDTNGGAISFSIKRGFLSFKNCSFVNNNSTDLSSYGGAIYFSDMLKDKLGGKINLSLSKCCFYNNKACSTKGKSYGGAIYFYFRESTYFFSHFEDSEFINNSAISNSQSYGGAFYFQIEKCKKFCNVFNRLTFINNIASSLNLTKGGAISAEIVNSKTNSTQKFEDCLFSDNKALSNSSTYGGALYFSIISEGIFQNCKFINNHAKTLFLNNPKDKIYTNKGGAVFFSMPNIKFEECSFINNSCFGCSSRIILERKGGAIFSNDGYIKIIKSIFKNNTLIIFGSKINKENCQQGGACCFDKTYSNLNECEFIDNKAIIDDQENSINSSSKNFGGAIYSSNNIKNPLKCKNCTFTNNEVFNKREQKNEFAGALYLTKGEIINCTFNENSAYNGCDIMYEIKHYTYLCSVINNCNFIHYSIEKRYAKSLFYFLVNYNETKPIEFTNNKVINNVNAYLFDGKIEINNYKLKLSFRNNCVSPFNDKFYKTDEMLIFAENSMNFVDYNSVFETSCFNSIVTQTLPIEITHTEHQIFTQNTTDSNSKNNEKSLKKIYILLIAIIISQICLILLLFVLFVLVLKRKNNRYDIIEPQEFVFN